jgi:hypothetical protein
MKTWWIEKGWPWLRENWWVLLLLPILGLVALGMAVWNRPILNVVEPLREADELAKKEAADRETATRAEKLRLEAELIKIREEHAKLEANFEARLEAKVEDLRSDPAKLRETMLAAGRGGR